MSEKIRLKDLFAGLQEQIEARFSVNREFITHPGSKGDALYVITCPTDIVWIKRL